MLKSLNIIAERKKAKTTALHVCGQIKCRAVSDSRTSPKKWYL